MYRDPGVSGVRYRVMVCRTPVADAGNVWNPSRNAPGGVSNFAAMSIKYYAHFLVDEPDTRVLQEYRGVVELDSIPSRGGEMTWRF